MSYRPSVMNQVVIYEEKLVCVISKENDAILGVRSKYTLPDQPFWKQLNSANWNRLVSEKYLPESIYLWEYKNNFSGVKKSILAVDLSKNC